MRITKKDEFKAAIAAQLMIIYSSDTSNFMLRYLRKHYRKEIRENERYEHPLGIEISVLMILISLITAVSFCLLAQRYGSALLYFLVACIIIFICISLPFIYHFYVRNKRIRFWYYSLLEKNLNKRLEKNKSFKGEELYKLVADETMRIIQVL